MLYFWRTGTQTRDHCVCILLSYTDIIVSFLWNVRIHKRMFLFYCNSLNKYHRFNPGFCCKLKKCIDAIDGSKVIIHILYFGNGKEFVGVKSHCCCAGQQGVILLSVFMRLWVIASPPCHQVFPCVGCTSLCCNYHTFPTYLQFSLLSFRG